MVTQNIKVQQYFVQDCRKTNQRAWRLEAFAGIAVCFSVLTRVLLCFCVKLTRVLLCFTARQRAPNPHFQPLRRQPGLLCIQGSDVREAIKKSFFGEKFSKICEPPTPGFL